MNGLATIETPGPQLWLEVPEGVTAKRTVLEALVSLRRMYRGASFYQIDDKDQWHDVTESRATELWATVAMHLPRIAPARNPVA